MRGIGLILLALLSLLSGVHSQGGWSQDEMEIFDLVEDVEKNFYEFMGLSKDASGSEIRKAYRRLSLQLHPDKNPSPDASLQFRLLAGIYEVLKDAGKREIYDRVLIEGLPSWRNPVFYYRRVRKMGLAEGIAYLLVIVSVCQYLINWAAYWERGFTLREVMSSQNKRKKGKLKVDVPLEEEESLLGPKPTYLDTLPFQLFRGGKYLIMTLPYVPKYVYDIYLEKKEQEREKEELLAQEEAALRRKEEEKKVRKEQKAKRKRVYREEAPDNAPEQIKVKEAEKVFSQPANALQVWTDEDLAKLAKLMKKFPGGVRDRWERIAEIMERLPWEVTKMAQKVKDMGYSVPIASSAQSSAMLETDKVVSDNCLEDPYEEESEESSSSGESEDDEEYGVYKLETRDPTQAPLEPLKTKRKTKGGKLGLSESNGDDLTDENAVSSGTGSDNWTQQQQKALENALQSFPKGISERWDRIAAKVPGKSKQECMLRFKTLAEEIKKRKTASS